VCHAGETRKQGGAEGQPPLITPPLVSLHFEEMGFGLKGLGGGGVGF
jgi:hypothetical protein